MAIVVHGRFIKGKKYERDGCYYRLRVIQWGIFFKSACSLTIIPT